MTVVSESPTFDNFVEVCMISYAVFLKGLWGEY